MARQMKDSGVEWIGEIPEEWSSRKLKMLVQESNCLFIDGEWIESKDISSDGIRYFTTGNVGDGVFKEQGAGYISEDTFLQLNCTEVRGGDLVFSRLNLPVGRACILPAIERCVVAVDIVIARLNSQCVNKYVVYATMCDRYQALTSILARGTTMQRISRTQMGNIYFPLPSYAEQKSIVIYLDSKCAEIDKVVEQTRATIEEYKKLKQAIITEAVTKGVRGPRPMKPSGVEWIGDIPEEWKISRIKDLGKCSNGISKSGEYFGSGSPFVTYKDVYDNFSIISPTGLIESNTEEQSTYSVEKDDVFFTRTSETIEEIGFSSVCCQTIPNATFAGFIIRFRPQKGLLYCGYTKYYFRSNIHRSYFNKEMNIVTRASLSQTLLKKLSVLLPQYKEQQEIAAYLDTKCAEIDRIIEKKEQLIEELGSYKKSLIYEYVTGKKEVTA